MAFMVTCDFCNGRGQFEFDNGNVFIVCEDCGQEREVTYPHKGGDEK